MTVAPLSDRLFMILRELPEYFSTAYKLRFRNADSKLNTTIFVIFKRCVLLIYELISYRPTLENFQRNSVRLDLDFAALNETIKDNDKPICAYFVSSEDSNGAILGDPVYYYHHYKINNFQKQYAVAAKVVRSMLELFDSLKTLKERYPNREIKVVDIVSHGAPEILGIGRFGYPSEAVVSHGFKECAKDATIILDACSSGKGANSIAQKIAENNPGKTVLAPGAPLFFSKPIIKVQEQKATIEHLVHGFAIIDAYTAKKFHVDLTFIPKPSYRKIQFRVLASS
ncbi:MAG: hypothetical protein JWO53_239 [Chlamydiia bacterium]|nr:hypothetical protein [Chlamydiia bacterium]